MSTQDSLSRPTRVALLVPSSNTIMENDLHAALPKAQFSVHTARMFLTETTREQEIAMIERHAPKAADDLGTLNPDLLVFGCTSAGSLFGLAYDAKVCRELGARAGCPAIGVVSSATKALAAVQSRRLAVLTPYNEDLTRSVASAVSSEREIVCAYGMGITDNVALADPTPDDILAFAVDKLVGQRFDCVFISCTNFRAYETKERIRERFGVPVVTSNSAVVDAIQAMREGLLLAA